MSNLNETTAVTTEDLKACIKALEDIQTPFDHTWPVSQRLYDILFKKGGNEYVRNLIVYKPMP
jgi:hypothetical protein